MPSVVDGTDQVGGNPPQEVIFSLLSLAQSGEYLRAAGEAEALLIDFPRSFDVLSLCVSVYARLGRMTESLDVARLAVSYHPDSAAAHHNLGIALRTQDRDTEALAAFTRAVELDDKLGASHFYRGLLLHQIGAMTDAIIAFNMALESKQDLPLAHYYRGCALAATGEHQAAITAFDEAIRYRPNLAEAYNDKGVVLMAVMDMDAAELAFEKAIEIQPDFAVAHDNLGNTLSSKGDLDKALKAFEDALSLDPNAQGAKAQKLFIKAQICDLSPTADNSAETIVDHVSPFCLMALEDSPERQLVRSAQHWARRTGSTRPVPLPAKPELRPSRLRVGYFSSDFHEHATLRLMSGLFREHDRTQFEIFVYSYGVAKDGGYREEVRNCDLCFHDVQSLSNEEIVKLARADKLDIAIDLKGYTAGTRSELFAYRLAPIQINYLGYPGTIVTDAMDYIVADDTIIPIELRSFYSESVLYLPHTYQPNDSRREIAPTTTKRADFGLPKNGFVFCCFNNSYKIGREEFDIWMRILSKVEGSVLWLLTSNSWMEQNLCKEAAIRGIDPDRLIFSEKISYREHLARHKHADLFLDTFNYNAHTTASDALWAGLPVVTKLGRQFSARVCASVLKAVGLSELITETAESYEHMIMALATHPKDLRKVRTKLMRNRVSHPLFDTTRYTRNFETGLQFAYDEYFEGNQPSDILVPDYGKRGQS